MTDTVNGVRWEIFRVVSVTDGDTLRALRSRVVDMDGKRWRLSDAEEKGIAIRLSWLDTPERGEVGWSAARTDLQTWITAHLVGLQVVIFGSAGWDRLLGDVQSLDGESASQWMMSERGWLPFTG